MANKLDLRGWAAMYTIWLTNIKTLDNRGGRYVKYYALIGGQVETMSTNIKDAVTSTIIRNIIRGTNNFKLMNFTIKIGPTKSKAIDISNIPSDADIYNLRGSYIAFCPIDYPINGKPVSKWTEAFNTKAKIANSWARLKIKDFELSLERPGFPDDSLAEARDYYETYTDSLYSEDDDGNGNSFNKFVNTVVSSPAINKLLPYLFERTNIRDVRLGNNITSIGHLAFAGCKDLKSVKLDKSLIEIGAYAFVNCKSLQEINLEDCTNLTIIQEGAFFNSGLKKLIIPDSVEFIGRNSLSHSLTQVEIPFNCVYRLIGKYLLELEEGNPDLANLRRPQVEVFDLSINNPIFINAMSRIGVNPEAVVIRR